MSLLRLNQLNYFDPLKVDQDSEPHQNQKNGTVDLLLKVQGKGQELHRPERRRQRPLRRLPRPQLPDQQLPRPGRNAERPGQPRQSAAQPAASASTSRTSATSPSSLGFQVFTSKYDYNAAKNYQISPAARNLTRCPAVPAAELQPVLHRLHRLRQLSASGTQLQARRRHLLVQSAARSPAFSQASTNALPDARLPQRHPGPERARAASITSQASLSASPINKIGNPLQPARRHGAHRRCCSSPASAATSATSARSSNTGSSSPCRD